MIDLDESTYGMKSIEKKSDILRTCLSPRILNILFEREISVDDIIYSNSRGPGDFNTGIMHHVFGRNSNILIELPLSDHTNLHNKLFKFLRNYILQSKDAMEQIDKIYNNYVTNAGTSEVGINAIIRRLKAYLDCVVSICNGPIKSTIDSDKLKLGFFNSLEQSIDPNKFKSFKKKYKDELIELGLVTDESLDESLDNNIIVCDYDEELGASVVPKWLYDEWEY